MKSILIKWVLPTTRVQGGALRADELANVVLELSADGGANFALLGTFTPGELQTVVADLPFSNQYVVRGRVTDTQSQVSQWNSVSFEVADNSPPEVLIISVEYA